MKRRSPANVAASVRARLQQHSKKTGEDFQFLLQRYASERFLYRLGLSVHRGRYVLKGAMLFALWGGSLYRPTRDLDFTGYGSAETNDVLASLREVCSVPVVDDGLSFDLATLAAEPIRDDSEYRGLRIRLRASLDNARIPMQIDIGFGNAIEPPAIDAEYPTLLGSPAPNIRAYPLEAVVAEKLHAIVVLGERNSRYKDFYDLYVLARQFPFDGARLTPAIIVTFTRRRTAISAALPAGFAPRFFVDDARAGQWRAYLSRNNLPGAPSDFAIVGELLQAFLGPVWRALAAGWPIADSWPAGGPWASAHPSSTDHPERGTPQ
jgi:predicted nucleotidyltransferase component of viral defense system